MSKPVDLKERNRIIEAIKSGLPRNQIARDFGRSPDTISRIAKETGLVFDRAQTKAATEAKRADNRARRAELAEGLLTKALGLLEEMESPYVAFRFGGKDNTYNEKVLPKPTDSATRNLMVSLGIAIQRLVELEKIDAPGVGFEALDRLVDVIGKMREQHGGDAS